MDNDSKLIFEKYDELHEGIFSRGKAQVAGAVGAAKGLGDKIAGSVKGAVAGLKGDQQGFNAAQAQRQAGANAGQNAKIESYRKTIDTKIQRLSQEMLDDIKKLGISVPKGNTIPNFLRNMRKAAQYLMDGIENPNNPTQPVNQQPPKPAAPNTQPANPAAPAMKQPVQKAAPKQGVP